MIRGIIKISGAVMSVIAGIILFIFGESILVTSIYYFGPIVSFILFFSIFFSITILIINLYFKNEKLGNKLIINIKSWIINKELYLNQRKLRLLKYGKIIGIILLGVTAGPLLTSVFICILDYQLKEAYLIAFLVNVLFFFIWIGIYSGGIEIVKILF